MANHDSPPAIPEPSGGFQGSDRAQAEHRLSRLEQQLDRLHCSSWIDELGYLPLACEAAASLFQVVSQRTLKGSIVLTTNRGIGPAWAEIFQDAMVAASMLDRLLAVRVPYSRGGGGG